MTIILKCDYCNEIKKELNVYISENYTTLSLCDKCLANTKEIIKEKERKYWRLEETENNENL